MTSRKPKTSIVVLAYNGCDALTRPCIESLQESNEPGTYELVLVDNASIDATAAYLRRLSQDFSNISLCLNEENKGYAGGNNDGLLMATGEFIVLLNNDTLVSRGWLEPMLRLLATNPEVGLVGPVTNSAGNEQRIDLPGLNEKNFNDVAAPYTKSQEGNWFETEKLGFFCVAGRREVFEKVGLLDEAFGIGMFEDDDYCVRVRNAGYKLAVIEDSFVYHKGSMSFKRLPSDDYLNLFEKNRAYFFNKHQLTWTYADIATAIWKCIKNSIVDGGEASLQRAQVRFQLMEDALHQLRQREENSIVFDGVNTAERKLQEKHRQLMEISDWATKLHEESQKLSLAMAKKHDELMRLSDWATELNESNAVLARELRCIRSSFFYRVLRRMKLISA